MKEKNLTGEQVQEYRRLKEKENQYQRFQKQEKKRKEKLHRKILKQIDAMYFLTDICRRLRVWILIFITIFFVVVVITNTIHQGLQIEKIDEYDYKIAMDLAKNSYYNNGKDNYYEEYKAKKSDKDLIRVTIQNKGIIIFDFSKNNIEIEVIQYNFCIILLEEILKKMLLYALIVLGVEIILRIFLVTEVKNNFVQKEMKLQIKKMDWRIKLKVILLASELISKAMIDVDEEYDDVIYFDGEAYDVTLLEKLQKHTS